MPIELPPPPPPERRVFTNRTLNLRAIRAIGYDMDYTLIHYHVDVWEKRAYQYARDTLAEQGWPCGDLSFDSEVVHRGLILDIEQGNVVKADRFGYIKAGAHGTQALEFGELRERYSRTHVDLRDGRWVFLSTLFDISLGCLYAQLVDELDAHRLPTVMGYRELFANARKALDTTHIEGRLKAEIIEDPATYVDLDPDVVQTLRDQRNAGKKVLLITNSEWHYTDAMMRFAIERYLPPGTRWRELFDMVIVEARKPSFFQDSNPIYEVVDETGLLRTVVGPLADGGVYHGGSAALIEEHLGLAGGDILFVGDHIFADVNVSKRTVRWRTALILRELEEDVAAIADFAAAEQTLSTLMDQKIELERQLNTVRLALARNRDGDRSLIANASQADAQTAIEAIKGELAELDTRISPLAERSSQLRSPRWGLVMRAGIDKSHMARQIERFADVYMSRVSNFLHATPNVYLRAPKSSLPHDQ